MKCFILAGGLAKRLWPLTEHFPKALLSLAGKPVIQHVVENVARIGAVSKIEILPDAPSHDLFTNELKGVLSAFGNKILIAGIPLSNGAPLGPLEKLRHRISSSGEHDFDPLLLIGADNVFGFELSRLVAAYLESEQSYVAIHRSRVSKSAKQFGVPSVDKAGRVLAIREKPVQGTYKLRSTACYIIHPKDIPLIQDYLSDSRDDNLGHFFGWAANETEVSSFQFQNDWYDVGTREGLLAAQAFLLKSDRSTPRFGVNGSSTVTPPVLIENTASLQNSHIGPNVYLGHKCHVINSRITNSIVYDNCIITNSRLANCVVGPKSRIEGNASEATFGPGTRVVADAD